MPIADLDAFTAEMARLRALQNMEDATVASVSSGFLKPDAVREIWSGWRRAAGVRATRRMDRGALKEMGIKADD
jgi:hypothetical protein